MKNPKGPAKAPKERTQEDSQNENKKLSISLIVDSMDPPYRDVYKDPSEIQNYSQNGSYFHRKNISEIRDMVKTDALKHGLHQSQLADFKNGSDLWKGESESRRVGKYEILFKDQKPFSTGQGILPDGSLSYTVSFPTKMEKEDAKKNSYFITVQCNFEITSKREIFSCTENEFRARDLLANIPEEPIQSRWSMISRKDFLYEMAHVDPWIVFKKIKGIFDKYIDFGEIKGGSTVCAVYCILTYLFVMFDAIPYLKIEGITNSGKSKLGEIFLHLAFNATMGVDQTPSVVYRTIEAERSTLIVDEIEGLDKNRQTDRMLELFPIFNSGYKPTGSVMRTEGNSLSRKRVSYSTYSPKIFCAIDPLLETIKNRSYIIMLVRTLDEKRSNLSISSKDPAWQEIRDNLYILAMEYFEEIREVSDSMEITNDLKLIGRDYEKAKPILAIARFLTKYSQGDQSVLQEVKDFIEQQKSEDQEHAMGSKEAQVILEIEALINESKQSMLDSGKSDNDMVQIKIPDLSESVSNALGYNPEKLNKMSFSRNISNTVKRLGLMRNRKTIGKRITTFECSLSLIKEAKQRYKMEVDTPDQSHPSIPSIPTHPSHINSSKFTPPENPNLALSISEAVKWDTWVSSKCTGTEERGWLIRVCTQNPGRLNPFKKLRKGTAFRIHSDEISSYKFYDFSRDPEKGEVLDNDDDIHFIETFKAAEIKDRQKRVKQLLILVIGERPEKSIVNLKRRFSDLEPGLSLAEIDAALKELIVMGLIHKSDDGHYMSNKEGPV